MSEEKIDLRQAAQQALNYIVATNSSSRFLLVPASNLNKTIDALRAALAEPEYQSKSQADTKVNPSEPEQPVAWSFELAMTKGEHGYGDWSHPRVTQHKPNVPEGSIRNLTPLCPCTAPAPRKPEQEPVAWAFRYDDGTYHDPSVTEHSSGMVPLCPCTAPAPRKPLTDEEIINIGKEARAIEGPHILPVSFARAIERAHGITGDSNE